MKNVVLDRGLSLITLSLLLVLGKRKDTEFLSLAGVVEQAAPLNLRNSIKPQNTAESSDE